MRRKTTDCLLNKKREFTRDNATMAIFQIRLTIVRHKLAPNLYIIGT